MEASAAVGQLDQIKKIQRVVRIINLICAGTGVGLIITFLIMNTQLILGNGMGVSLVPKLEGPELFLVVLLDFIMVFIMIIFLGTLVIITDTGSSNSPVPAASPSNPGEMVPQKTSLLNPHHLAMQEIHFS